MFRLVHPAGVLPRLGVLIAVCLAIAGPAGASSVAIVRGNFWTPDLENRLVANGVTVTEITSYTAASLAPFDTVIHYGNSHTDMAALDQYVQGGGRLVVTPWFWLNYTPPPSLQVISNGGSAQFRVPYPGITVLNGSDPLMQGVTVPSTPGGFDVGRTIGNTFVAGATQVATWADGTAMIGYKSVGSGEVIGINLHVITGDCAYEVINQPWATQIFLNAVECAPPIPEPLTLFATMAGLGAVAAYLRKRLRV